MQQKVIINRLSSFVCRLLSVLGPLHLSRILYKSTLFMQNKPNFQDAQMNVNSLLTIDYENKSNWTLGENKPNSNPNKPNCRKGKIDAKCVFTKDYRKKDDFTVRINKPNSNPISEKPKMNVNLYVIEDYRKKDDFLVRINKANFRNGQNERKLNFNKGLQKKRFFAAQNTNPIQTQSKPVLSAVEWAKFRTLFTLTARPVRKKTLSFNGAGDYNGIFSQMSFFQRTPIERG